MQKSELTFKSLNDLLPKYRDGRFGILQLYFPDAVWTTIRHRR